MTITTTSIDGDSMCLAVEGAMTVYEAGANKAELLDALADGKGLDIDLAQVDEIDTAGLQLLVLTRREGLKAGKPVRLLAPSAAVLEVLARYGLGPCLEDTATAPPSCNATGESS